MLIFGLKSAAKIPAIQVCCYFGAMKPLLFSLVFVCVFSALTAQSLSDNFSDGDFTSNPPWFGDTALFAVTNGELQLRHLNPAANNTSYLAVAAATSANQATTWEFYVRLVFAPSTTNFARIYLASSAPNLTGALDGYFVRVGGISGDLDALELYRQTGNTTTLLISGQAGAVALEPVIARVRVTRSASGEWRMFADYSGGQNPTEQGAPVVDLTHRVGGFMGVYCRYTSTRGQAFFFDDFLVNPLFVDNTPPMLIGAQADSATAITAIFDEPLDVISAQTPSNYLISGGIGQPAAAQLMPGNPTRVQLTLATPLANLQNYTLTCSGIRDEAGNTAGIQTANFTYLNIQPAEPGDLVVTEFMPDPTPVVSVLPNAEYIELYNRSTTKVIQLQNIRYSTGGTPQTLPNFLLLPQRYVIVCAASQASAFSAFGDVAPLSSFPALVNEGDEIIITNTQGTELFYLEYNLSWYRDATKTDGGWSLEMIDLLLPGNCPSNWRASVHPQGGTPGQPNAVAGSTGDRDGPLLLNAAVLTPTTVQLQFDEPVLAANLSAGLFSVSEGIGVASAILLSPATRVLITLAQPLSPGRTYLLTVGADIRDCLGNAFGAPRTVRIGLPEPILPGDLVINEILFNPATGGSDFLELYNRSSKILNLNEMQIRNTQRTSSNLSTFSQNFFLFPGEYVAISNNINDIQSRYRTPNIGALVQHNIPSFDDKSGNVTIQASGVTIDAFDYTEALHTPLLDTKDGVSLERLDPDSPTQSPGNWHSAAASVGFATPGYQNSQFRQMPVLGEEVISLPNKTFSPDGDGFEDVLQIFYETDKPGYVLNLRVFDAQGRQVRNLLRNELLGTSGIFKWEGVNDEGFKARTGIYILWIELFHPDGTVQRFKKTCVLAGRI